MNKTIFSSLLVCVLSLALVVPAFAQMDTNDDSDDAATAKPSATVRAKSTAKPDKTARPSMSPKAMRTMKPEMAPRVGGALKDRKDKEATGSDEMKESQGNRARIKEGVIKSLATNSMVVTYETKDYTVNTSVATKLRRRYGGEPKATEFAVGNKVNVLGTYTDDTKTVINATLVHNVSIQKRNGTFVGDVKSKTANGFVITSKNRGDQSVVLATGSATFVNRNNQPSTLSEIAVGDRVAVRGVWDRENGSISEVKRVKNFSKPARSPRPSMSPKASGSASASASTTASASPTATVVASPASNQ